jgi:NADH-quinone oxidoreductase subunit A
MATGMSAMVAALASGSFGADASATPSPSIFDTVFPLTILLIIAVLVPSALMILNRVISRWAVGTRNDTDGRHQPYEAGLTHVVGGAGDRFDLKFYLIAMLFLVFDVEIAFLYPWAIHFGKGGWAMVGVLAIFLIMLEAVYLYLYKKGALDWER